MVHTISALVEHRKGVLARVAGLFARRGINIESLSVNRTHRPELARMTICVEGSEEVLEQVRKQLEKLIEVVKVYDYSSDPTVERELALIKVTATARTRAEIIQICNVFRAQIVDVAPESLIVSATGDAEKIEALERMLAPYGIKETSRSGRVALARGA